MDSAITKTLSLLLLILVGYFFQSKIKSKDQREGIKTLILSLALPATILIALLQIDFESGLILIPVMSLGFNIVMHLLVDRLPLQATLNIPASQYRTLIMLVPSLAPGLSCFPFIIEYSGQGPLAMAALADVGNKIFVLIISYTIAMKWYYDVNKASAASGKSRLKDLLIALLNEPVNIVIVVAITMLSFGLNYKTFPVAVSLTVDRLSMMMTPLILIFMGLSMKLSWGQVKTIFSFLFFRSSIAFALSGVVLYFFPANDIPTMLLIVVFPQSACSFWPYAHMAAVGQMENRMPGERSLRTFDQDFAMNVLACSMPFSVIIIMTIYSSGDLFAHSRTVFASAGIFMLAAVGTMLLVSRTFSLYKTEPQGDMQAAENTATQG